MKNTYAVTGFFLLFLLGLTEKTSAQKVDLDKFRVAYERILLPQKYTPIEKRGYKKSVKVGSNFTSVISEEKIRDKFKIYNFNLVDDSPFLDIKIDLGDLTIERMAVKENTLSKTTTPNQPGATYIVRAYYSSKGQATMTVVNSPKPVEVPLNSDDLTLDREMRPEALQVGNVAYWESSEFKSYKEASDFIANNRELVKQKIVEFHINKASARVNYTFNEVYGFMPEKSTDILWTLGSKKHPEYEAFQDACNKIKTAMATVRTDGIPSDLMENLKPVITYFETIKSKYSADEKADKKLRYGSFYNLAFLYYYLDLPDKTIEQGNNLVKNDYDTKDGENWIKKATELKQAMERNKVSSTHMPVVGM